MTTAQLVKLANVLDEIRIPAGRYIFKEGDAGSSMYIIGEGKVRISKMIPGSGEEALAILDKGSYFGEMAIIEESARSADAIAHTSCTLYKLERDRLDQVMFTDKDFACALLWTFVRTLSSRLRDTNEKLRASLALGLFGNGPPQYFDEAEAALAVALPDDEPSLGASPKQENGDDFGDLEVHEFAEPSAR